MVAVVILLEYTKKSFTDPRDGKKYKTVKIGVQTWMAENLNYNASGSKCYMNNTLYCDKYGRLYDWNTAIVVCPKGWHLPSGKEWNVLMTTVGGEETAGKYLKAKSGWYEDEFSNGNGKDKYGFTALPGGSYNDYSDSFNSVGYLGYWWSATEYYASTAYYQDMSYSYASVCRNGNDKLNYLSVRCIKD
jgi:uncharacterized protein (TIGR02145 family)